MVELHKRMMFQKETEQIRICQLEKVTTREKCKACKEIKVLQGGKCREKIFIISENTGEENKQNAKQRGTGGRAEGFFPHGFWLSHGTHWQRTLKATCVCQDKRTEGCGSAPAAGIDLGKLLPLEAPGDGEFPLSLSGAFETQTNPPTQWEFGCWVSLGALERGIPSP